MAALRLEQLEAHLARELESLYVIHGDEALLALEAADAIRSRARACGFSERVVLAAERVRPVPSCPSASRSRQLAERPKNPCRSGEDVRNERADCRGQGRGTGSSYSEESNV